MKSRKSCLWIASLVLGIGVCANSAAIAADRAPKVTTIAVPHGGRPIVAKCDAEGTIHMVYDSADGPQYVRSIDNGKTLGSAIPLVDAASRKPGLEFNTWDMAVGPGGVVHVALGTNAWKLKLPTDQWGYYYARLEKQAKSFEPLRNINHKPSEGFSLAADERGNVTACWMADKLFANVSHDNGKTFGPIIEIDATLNPCNCCTTACTYAADGRLAILYREETNNDRDMFLALWNEEGNQVTRSQISSTLWKIDSCPMTYYSITATRDGFVAAWPTRGDIYFARLDREGEVLPPGEIKTPGANGMRTGVIALNDTTGNTLVAWKKDGQLGWQCYDQRGRPIGHAGSAPSAGSGAAGVVSKSGQFILFR